MATGGKTRKTGVQDSKVRAIMYDPKKNAPKTVGGDITDARVELGKGVPGTQGEGWVLIVRTEDAPNGIALTSVDVVQSAQGNGGGDAPSSLLYITDVSDSNTIKLPTAPLETGMVKHDHKVLMPREMKITGSVKRGYTHYFNELLRRVALSKSLDTYFTLISPWKNYPALYLKTYTSKASSKKYDVYDYTITLQELLIASNLTDTTDNADLASNTNKGAISGK